MGCTPSPDFLDGVDKLIHELVHVKQYRNFGQEGFLTTYALSTIDYWASTRPTTSTAPQSWRPTPTRQRLRASREGTACRRSRTTTPSCSQFNPPLGPVICM